MGNSNVSQHSKWRTVSPENSLLDHHEGHFSRSSEVPNALVCWDQQMQRNTNGIWSPMSSRSRDPSGIRNKDSEPFDKNKTVGFFGDNDPVDNGKNGKKRIGKKAQEHTEVKRNLNVSDEIISSPTLYANITILYNEDILQCPKHCSLAASASADLNNQLEHDTVSRCQRKFGRYEEFLRQDQQPGGLVILTDAGRFIYYLITKKKYWEAQSEENLTKSLMTMAAHCNDMHVRHLAISNLTSCAIQWNKIVQITKNFLLLGLVVTVMAAVLIQAMSREKKEHVAKQALVRRSDPYGLSDIMKRDPDLDQDKTKDQQSDVNILVKKILEKGRKRNKGKNIKKRCQYGYYGGYGCGGYRRRYGGYGRRK